MRFVTVTITCPECGRVIARQVPVADGVPLLAACVSECERCFPWTDPDVLDEVYHRTRRAVVRALTPEEAA